MARKVLLTDAQETGETALIIGLSIFILSELGASFVLRSSPVWVGLACKVILFIAVMQRRNWARLALAPVLGGSLIISALPAFLGKGLINLALAPLYLWLLYLLFLSPSVKEYFTVPTGSTLFARQTARGCKKVTSAKRVEVPAADSSLALCSAAAQSGAGALLVSGLVIAAFVTGGALRYLVG